MTAPQSTAEAPVLPWLAPGDPFPDTCAAWPDSSPAPGLLAAGGELDNRTLMAAYSRGIFPWFSTGQPILWWSTAPRMVLRTGDFLLHQSLRKQIRSLIRQQRLRIRLDSAFETVIRACAHSPRNGQNGTWITDDMVQAYIRLHQAGHAHSVETWIDGQLAGGLYAVSIGRMVYGESMFTRVSNASKMALVALVSHCQANDMPAIDCQQETRHLASMGAAPIERQSFESLLMTLTPLPGATWQFDPSCWTHLIGVDT